MASNGNMRYAYRTKKSAQSSYSQRKEAANSAVFNGFTASICVENVVTTACSQS